MLHHPHPVSAPDHEWSPSRTRRHRQDGDHQGPGPSTGRHGVRLQLLGADGLQGTPHLWEGVLGTGWQPTLGSGFIHATLAQLRGPDTEVSAGSVPGSLELVYLPVSQ